MYLYVGYMYTVLKDWEWGMGMKLYYNVIRLLT